MGKHEEHMCRFNDGECSCDCYDKGIEKGYKDGKKFNSLRDLGILRQYFGECSRKNFKAGELYEIFNTFAPLMSEETQEKLIDCLDKLGNCRDKSS